MYFFSEHYIRSWNMTLNTTWFVRTDKKETFERRKELLKLIKTMIERSLIKVFYLNDKPKCSVTVFDCIQRVYSLLFFMCGVCIFYLFYCLVKWYQWWGTTRIDVWFILLLFFKKKRRIYNVLFFFRQICWIVL
jgi:hypothetical protein